MASVTIRGFLVLTDFTQQIAPASTRPIKVANTLPAQPAEEKKTKVKGNVAPLWLKMSPTYIYYFISIS